MPEPPQGQGIPPSTPPRQPAPQYQPGNDASLTPSRRNWAPCYIVTCTFLLLLIAGSVILAIWLGGKLGKGVLGGVFTLGTRLSEMQAEVTATPEAEIKAAAQAISSGELAANPDNYSEQWVAVEGTLASEPSMTQGQFNWGGSSSSVDGMLYEFGNSVLAIDVSGSPQAAHAGDTVVIYGKPVVWDFSDITSTPFLGNVIQEEMKKDPQLQGNMRVIFIISNKVELIQSAALAPPPDGEGVDALTASPDAVPAETEPPSL